MELLSANLICARLQFNSALILAKNKVFANTSKVVSLNQGVVS